MSGSDSTWKEWNKTGTEYDWSGTPDWLSMEDLSDEVTFKQRADKNEGESHAYVWGRVLQGEGTVSEKCLKEKFA